MRPLVLVLSVSVAFAAPLTMPEWLAPYPGTAADTQASNGLIESSYKATAKPADIVAHYQKELEAQGVESRVNDDGLGLSMRASVPECDLLIRVRERDGKSFVSVNCSEKSAAASQATYFPSRNTGARPFPKTQAERDAYREQMAANMHVGMKKYDQPVYPGSQAPISLSWPSWLVTANGANHGLDVKRNKYASGLEYLESNYKTSAPMSEIYEFYRNLMQANGYPVGQSRLSTGSTSTHVQQNKDGYVEGSVYPNGNGNGSIVIRADFSRMFLNEPITVRLSVSVYQPARSSRN